MREALQRLLRLYREEGAEAVRAQLAQTGLPGEVIDGLLAQMAAAVSEANESVEDDTPATLPQDTVEMLAGNTYAVKTEVPDKLDEWRGRLQAIREDFAGRGADWAIEVAFAEALLAALDDQAAALAADNPYAPVVQAVVEAIAAWRAGQAG